MKKLISMVETVPEHPHAKFLQQTPTLGMFVPCDEEGNVLEEPEKYNDWLKFKNKYEYGEFYTKKCKQYQQAQQRVIFEGWELAKKEEGSIKIVNKEKERIYFFNDGTIIYNNKIIKTIEDLVPYNLILK